MAAVCHWGIESGKLVYPSMFGHVPNYICMHQPQTKQVVRSQAAEEVVRVHVITWQKNEWQESGAADNIKFCVKIGKSASETLALLTVAYDEYAMEKLSVFEWHK